MEQLTDTTKGAAADWLAEDALTAYDDDEDPLHEAKAAALEASQTLVKTLQAQLAAFEKGSLDEEEDANTTKETEELLNTVKLRVQEVENIEAEEAEKRGSTAGTTVWGTMKKDESAIVAEQQTPSMTEL